MSIDFKLGDVVDIKYGMSTFTGKIVEANATNLVVQADNKSQTVISVPDQLQYVHLHSSIIG